MASSLGLKIPNNLSLVSVLLLAVVVVGVSSERILFLLPLASKSHKIFFEPLIFSLAERGHRVTVLTSEKTEQPPWHNSSGVEELVPLPSEEVMMSYPDPFQSRKSGRSMAFPFQFVVEGCHKVIQSEIFQQVMMATLPQKPFDLIIVDSFLSNCLDGFIHNSGVPFILVTTMPAPSYISERVGNFLPPSIIPVLSFRGYGESDGEMSFAARLRNFLHFMVARVYVNFVMVPSLEKVYKEYLGEDLPGIFEIEEDAQMIFMNSHYSMNFPRPLLPAVKEVGGIHCRRSKPLNHGLAKFVSKASSPNGFIYFSIGSIIKISNAPNEFINALFSAFSKLKQRVVIKWRKGLKRGKDNITSAQIPENVWIDDWFPQQDLLGHENIRLFISHGGLLSLQEAVYHSVPVLGIPFGMDQDTNVHNAMLQGYALKLDYDQLTEETLTLAMQQMLTDPSYAENVRQISEAFRQRQSTPLDTAIYWTEHVLSTTNRNVTNFLQSPARKLTIFQYYSCDILLFLLGISLVSLFALLSLVRRIRDLVSPATACTRSNSNFKQSNIKLD